MLKSIEEVYWIIDEIVKHGISNEHKKGRRSKLTVSETITILIIGHDMNYSTNKQLYYLTVTQLRPYFKNIPSYPQFTRAIRKSIKYLDLIIEVFTKINAQNIQEICIVDSTSLPVNNYNRKQTKWASAAAGTGKNMHGFYQGFKLHIIVNQNREIISAVTTKANVHDVQLLKNENFVQHVRGILVGDKGYVASEKDRISLKKRGIDLVAKQRKNMDPYLNEYYKPLLQKRKQIETVFGFLKTRAALIFPFARSAEGFLAHAKAALLAFMLRTVNLDYLYV